VEEIMEEAAELVARVAALDVGKASLTACVRVPHDDKPGRRRQEVRTFATTTRSLPELQDWLVCQGVTLCVMEATSAYWKPPFYLLEDAVECWAGSARDVKNVPGRPKTDRLDAVWLAKLAERGMLRPSFVPPPWQRELRDLCRYRRTLIRERTREKQRAEKLLEDAQIKLSSVISDIFGKSGRDMLEALIAGQRDPYVLAGLARTSMRGKKSVLAEALTSQAGALTIRIEEVLAPFAAQAARLDEVAGIGRTGAQELIAEIGVDMSRFPAAAHLVSWARYAPRARQSAGKHQPGTAGKGNPWLGGALGEAAIGASRAKTFPGSRHRRLARRRGKQRALVAVGNSILTIAWHLLPDPGARFTDLGPDWHDRLAPIRRRRQLIAELERLSGKKVLLQEQTAA
jgi:transposase